jgi:hypothetical protein
LGDLKTGEFRELNSSELRALKNAVKGEKGSKK